MHASNELQSEMVKRYLTNFIREKSLVAGDKLPTQAELRKTLHVGSKTIQCALNALAEAGIVELRKNRGVFLLRTDAAGFRGRKVGIVCMRLPHFVFGNSLLQALVTEFHDRGADCISFIRNEEVFRKERDSLDVFSGLRRAIENKQLDGVITTVPLDEEAVQCCKKSGMPLLYYGSLKSFSCRAYLPSFVSEALEKLLRSGCQRPAVFFVTRTQFDAHKAEVLNKNPGTQLWYNRLDEYPGYTRQKITAEFYRNMNEFCALPPGKRPDGIFIPDDFLTSAFCMELLKRGECLPRIICARTRQIPLFLPVPLCGWFEFDIAVYAGKMADALFSLIHGLEEKIELIFDAPYIEGGKQGGETI